jgi:hypothetical protein
MTNHWLIWRYWTQAVFSSPKPLPLTNTNQQTWRKAPDTLSHLNDIMQLGNLSRTKA